VGARRFKPSTGRETEPTNGGRPTLTLEELEQGRQDGSKALEDLQRRRKERERAARRIAAQSDKLQRELGAETANDTGISEGTRVLATQMAVAGNSRDEIAWRLREEFGLQDQVARRAAEQRFESGLQMRERAPQPEPGSQTARMREEAEQRLEEAGRAVRAAEHQLREAEDRARRAEALRAEAQEDEPRQTRKKPAKGKSASVPVTDERPTVSAAQAKAKAKRQRVKELAAKEPARVNGARERAAKRKAKRARAAEGKRQQGTRAARAKRKPAAKQTR
jgi:hypothetical protein